MGKKKDKRREHDRAKHGGGMAPLAGIAAVVAKQVATPAGRQMIAAGLMAAANAITARDAAARPTPPVPPTPPVQPCAGEPPVSPKSAYTGETPEPPRSDAPALPPEIAKVVGSVAAGLERWAASLGKPRPPAAGE